MIEIAVVLSAVVRHWPDFFIILVLLLANATIGFWEEREAGNAIDALKARLAIKARVKRDGKWVTPPAKDLVPGDAIRLRLGDIVPADARLLDGDEISVDQSALTGESLPIDTEFRRRGLLRLDHSSRRDRRAGLRDGRQNLFWQDGGTGRDGGHGQPFPEGRAEDRRLSHRSRVDHGGRDRRAIDLSRRSHSHDAAIRAGPDRGRHSRGDAHGVVGDDGGRRAQAREEAGDRQQTGRNRGIGRRRRALRRQDGHADAEQADARSALLPRQDHARRSHPGRRARLAPGERRHHRSGRARRPEGQGRVEALSGHAFHAVRSRAQAHRGDGEGCGRQDFQGHQGRAAGHPRPVRRTPRRSRTPSTRP